MIKQFYELMLVKYDPPSSHSSDERHWSEYRQSSHDAPFRAARLTQLCLSAPKLACVDAFREFYLPHHLGRSYTSTKYLILHRRPFLRNKVFSYSLPFVLHIASYTHAPITLWRCSWRCSRKYRLYPSDTYLENISAPPNGVCRRAERDVSTPRHRVARGHETDEYRPVAGVDPYSTAVTPCSPIAT